MGWVEYNRDRSRARGKYRRHGQRIVGPWGTPKAARQWLRIHDGEPKPVGRPIRHRRPTEADVAEMFEMLISAGWTPPVTGA